MRHLVVHCKQEPYDVYIGRPGQWGNPYRVGIRTAEEAVELYRTWLKQQIREDMVTVDDLASLYGKVLGCWCKTPPRYDQPCHGDVLVAAAEWAHALRSSR